MKNNDWFMEALDNLGKKDSFPITSQPSPGHFAEIFQKLLSQGKEIIVITISANFSGTYQSALAAASLVGEEKISVVDSLLNVAGLRMLVEDAAAAALEGQDRAAIVAMLEEKKHRMRVLLLPANLEHLRRGGRIGGAKALLGSLLNIRPVLYVTKLGNVEVLDKVRTLKKALNRMVEELPDNCIRASYGDFLGKEDGLLLKELAEAKLGRTIEVQQVGPVIATHTGPGIVGLFFEIPKE